MSSPSSSSSSLASCQSCEDLQSAFPIFQEADYEFYCLICGLPIFDYSDEAPPGVDATAYKWMSSAISLCDPNDEYAELKHSICLKSPDGTLPPLVQPESPIPTQPRAPILQLPVVQACKHVFSIQEEKDGPGHHFQACRPHHVPNQGMHIPIHQTCRDLADRAFRTSTNIHVTDWRGLWTCLRWRLDVSRETTNLVFCDEVLSPNYQLWPNRQYLSFSVPSDEDFVRQAVDPVRIPGLTEAVLANLTETPIPQAQMPADRDAATFRARYERLPLELRLQIEEHVYAARNMPLACSRKLPQAWWRAVLTTHMPFLWDLDGALVEQKARQACSPGHEWDWEFLCARLSKGLEIWETPVGDLWQHQVRGYENVLRDMPPGFTNRRRIWQLLEEMFVGDVVREVVAGPGPGPGQEPGLAAAAAEEPQRQGMYLFYDKRGERIHPWKFIPLVDMKPYVKQEDGQVRIREDYVEKDDTDAETPVLPVDAVQKRLRDLLMG